MPFQVRCFASILTLKPESRTFYVKYQKDAPSRAEAELTRNIGTRSGATTGCNETALLVLNGFELLRLKHGIVQHQLSGRFVPVMDAMRLAISRAAEQPVPAVKFANELPKWGHNIGDELTCTVFKGIVNMAPRRRQTSWRNPARWSACLSGRFCSFGKTFNHSLDVTDLTG